MRVNDPFDFLAAPNRLPLFVLMLVLTLALATALRALGTPLMTQQAPAGIVSFELAGSAPKAQQIRESWGPGGQIYAGLNLGLDYLFLVAYAVTIGLGCSLVAQRVGGRGMTIGLLLAWGQLLAGTLDALENYALIQLLVGRVDAAWPIVAWWCAIGKFALVSLGLGYLVLGAGSVLLRRVVRVGRSAV